MSTMRSSRCAQCSSHISHPTIQLRNTDPYKKANRATLPGSQKSFLPTDPQALDQHLVATGILPLQIVEQCATLTDQQPQTAARMVVLGVRLHVCGQLLDALREQGHLDLWRPRVSLCSLVLVDDAPLDLGIQHVFRCLVQCRRASQRAGATFGLIVTASASLGEAIRGFIRAGVPAGYSGVGYSRAPKPPQTAPAGLTLRPFKKNA